MQPATGRRLQRDRRRAEPSELAANGTGRIQADERNAWSGDCLRLLALEHGVAVFCDLRRRDLSFVYSDDNMTSVARSAPHRTRATRGVEDGASALAEQAF